MNKTLDLWIRNSYLFSVNLEFIAFRWRFKDLNQVFNIIKLFLNTFLIAKQIHFCMHLIEESIKTESDSKERILNRKMAKHLKNQ